ncbi:MAG: T9SS type A sorting domain-containing protein [Bacteroidetes bacterium]|nr:T9SS type A sorting domain-containing protein [Bacteroidota bacterium]
MLALDNITKTNLTIYPNPVQDNIKINFTKTDNYEINIFNSAGQKLIHKTVTSDFATIDLTTLNDGIYFITIDSRTERWTSKLLKKHWL